MQDRNDPLVPVGGDPGAANQPAPLSLDQAEGVGEQAVAAPVYTPEQVTAFVRGLPKEERRRLIGEHLLDDEDLQSLAEPRVRQSLEKKRKDDFDQRLARVKALAYDGDVQALAQLRLIDTEEAQQRKVDELTLTVAGRALQETFAEMTLGFDNIPGLKLTELPVEAMRRLADAKMAADQKRQPSIFLRATLEAAHTQGISDGKAQCAATHGTLLEADNVARTAQGRGREAPADLGKGAGGRPQTYRFMEEAEGDFVLGKISLAEMMGYRRQNLPYERVTGG